MFSIFDVDGVGAKMDYVRVNLTTKVVFKFGS